MGKGTKKDLFQNAGRANKLSDQYNANASSLYNFETPILESDVTNPQGYGKDLTAMNTASQQSLGGAESAAFGEGNLEAARTRNAGGFQGAVEKSARDAMKTQSQNAVSIQAANAKAKMAERESALGALTSFYGGDVNAAMKALELSNQALNDTSNVGPSIGQQLFNNAKSAALTPPGGDGSGA